MLILVVENLFGTASTRSFSSRCVLASPPPSCLPACLLLLLPDVSDLPAVLCLWAVRAAGRASLYA